MKRRLCLFMCAVFIIVSAAACGSGKGNVQTNLDGTTSKAADAAAAPKEPITLEVEVFDRGIQGNAPVDNNYMTKWINEEFGSKNNINVKFVPCIRNEELTKINIWMASGSGPDLMYTFDYNAAMGFAEQGLLTDLTSLVDQHGAQLKSFLGQVIEKGYVGDSLLFVPGRRTNIGIISNNIRKDWLDKLELPVPTTRDEWYNAIKMFKEKDPGNLGENNIPFGINMLATTWGHFNLMWSFDKKVPEEIYHTTLEWNLPGRKDGYAFLNKLYNEGLISPDFALDTDGKRLDANIANGFVGFYIHNYGWYIQNVFPSLKQNVPTAEYVACDPFKNEEGKAIKLANNIYGKLCLVPKFSTKAEAAVKYLNWQADSNVLTTIYNGLEGVHYAMVDGFPKANTGDFEKVFNGDYSYVIEGGMDYGSLEKYAQAQSLSYEPEYRQLILDQIKFAFTDAVGHNMLGAPGNLSELNIMVQKHSAAQTTVTNNYIAKIIMCKPEEFSDTYDNFIKELMENGGTEIEKAAKEAYERNKKLSMQN